MSSPLKGFLPLLPLLWVAFLMMLGLSIIFPVLPYYARALHLSEFEAGILTSAFAITSVLFSPLWGRISDRFGRKPPLFLGLLGFSLGFLWFGTAGSFVTLLSARIFAGVFASATLPSVMALAAEGTEPAQRSGAMGWLGASIGLGILFGPALGGAIAHFYGVRTPFFFTAILGLFGALSVLWVPAPSRSHAPSPRQEGSERWNALKGFLFFGFLLSLSQTSFEATLGFLVQDRFGKGPASVGLLLAGMAFLGVLLQGGGMPLLTKRYQDLSLLRTGTVLIALGLLGMGESGSFLLLVLSGLLFALGNGLARPTYAAILSRKGEAYQGEAQGLGQSAQSLGRAVGPLLATFLYEHLGPASPFVGVAILTLLSLYLLAQESDPLLKARPETPAPQTPESLP